MSKLTGLLFRFLAVLVASVVALSALFSIAYYYELYTPDENEPAPVLVLTGATVIPGNGKPPLPNATVIVGGERILRIQSEAAIPRNAPVVRVEGLFIVPALLDAAVYFEAPSQVEIDTMAGMWEWEINRSLPERRRALVEAGIGTALDLGSGLQSGLRTRAQLGSGELAGPRLLASGPILTAPESSWLHARYPLRFEKTTRIIETTAEGERWVQTLAAEGVDLVSVNYRTGPRMGSDDLTRIIQEAHDLGLRVVVETVSLEDARQATVAGADALLRGITRAGERVDGNLLSMMMEKGTVYIPALAAVETGQDAWSESLETALANTRLVSQAGVPVAAGSGAGAWDYGYGRTWQAELSLLRAAGLTPAEVLEAATIGAARLLGVDDRLGTVEENKLADLLVLRGNPLLDVGAMDQVQIVIRNGVIVVDQLSPLSD